MYSKIKNNILVQYYHNFLFLQKVSAMNSQLDVSSSRAICQDQMHDVYESLADFTYVSW